MVSKAGIIDEYEGKFEQVRNLITQKEMSISDLKTQVTNMSEKLITS